MDHGVGNADLLAFLQAASDVRFNLLSDANMTPFDQAFDTGPTPAEANFEHGCQGFSGFPSFHYNDHRYIPYLCFSQQSLPCPMASVGRNTLFRLPIPHYLLLP